MTTTYFKADSKDKRKNIDEQCQNCGCAFNSHVNGKCPDDEVEPLVPGCHGYVDDDDIYDRVEANKQRFNISKEV